MFRPTINISACLTYCMCSVAEPEAKTKGCSARVYSIYVLSMLLLTYLVNQLDRFLLGIVTKPMSQELDYGDWACMRNESLKQNAVVCNATNQREYVSIFSTFSQNFLFSFSTFSASFDCPVCSFCSLHVNAGRDRRQITNYDWSTGIFAGSDSQTTDSRHWKELWLIFGIRKSFVPSHIVWCILTTFYFVWKTDKK